MGLIKKYINQTRKPEGFLGKMMVKGMNGGHAKLADWGLSHLDSLSIKEDAKIAELGCGGGRNINALLKKFKSSQLDAIDYSEVSVNIAKSINEAAINSGRCTISQGDVSALKLQDNTYDLATAFETIYFWPDITKCFTEVARILKTGGSFLIVNEADGKDKTGLKYEKIIEGMKCHTVEEIEAALMAAGFSSVSSDHYKNKAWITV
ncbi:MAG: class I SAM-dependent methyltransferase, partial [Treponema sp.]|nr:class I SAM-dependent methyltransferase [Treponema sp.]